MGRRGPKPKPSALDKLDGGASHRRKNPDEPKPSASEATCPDWLRGDAVAMRVWESEAPRLIRLGLLTVVDRLLFAALCERASVYWRAARTLRRGLTHAQRANGRVRVPEVEIAKGALGDLKQLAAAFGMSPADRKGLIVALGAGASGVDEPAKATTATTEDGPPKAGTAIDLDDYLRRRDARRAGERR